MIPANHPIVLDLAAELASEHHTALVAAMVQIDGSVSFSLTVPPALVVAQAALLTDLTRPASRDAWVRWGIAWEGAKTLRVPASPANDHRQDTILYRWHMLRDNPSALTAAVCAALETM